MSTDPFSVLLMLHVVLACGAVVLGVDAAARGAVPGDRSWTASLAAASLGSLVHAVGVLGAGYRWAEVLWPPCVVLSVGLFWSGLRCRGGAPGRQWLPLVAAGAALTLLALSGTSQRVLASEVVLLVVLAWLVAAGWQLARSSVSHYLGGVTLAIVLAIMVLLCVTRIVVVSVLGSDVSVSERFLTSPLGAGTGVALAAGGSLAMVALRSGDRRVRDRNQFDPVLGVRAPRALAQHAERAVAAGRDRGLETGVLVLEIRDLEVIRRAYGSPMADAACEMVAATLIATAPRGALVGASAHAAGRFVAVLRHSSLEETRTWGEGVARMVRETALRADDDVLRLALHLGCAVGSDSFLELGREATRRMRDERGETGTRRPAGPHAADAGPDAADAGPDQG